MQNGFRALSTNNAGNDEIQGLLYVPDFPYGSPCIAETSQYIPQNATRMGDLPEVEQLFVAIAPWTSANCTLALLAAVMNTVKAFIFYKPDGSVGTPPPISDPMWGLGDGGSWKSKNNYPVYAVSGLDGSSIMNALAQYSGALLDAPNGTLLQDEVGRSHQARMYAVIELSNTTSLPSLWAFLLIVLGIVLLMIGMTSGVMHLYQRRRRNALRRRIINGEVDLERLGIKRLTVPQEAINMLPQFVYSPSEKELLDRSRDHVTALSDFPIKESDTNTAASNVVAPPPPPSTSPIPPHPEPLKPIDPPQHSTTPLRTHHPPQRSSQPTNQQPSYIQPTCPICLDDFIPHATTVRSLPCHHIYHPECIDPFLLRNSSLCPVCKFKVLPKGYCPATITNAMVRRERQQRRNRDRILRIRGPEAAAQMPVASLVEPAEPRRGRLFAVQGRMASFHRQFGRGSRPRNHMPTMSHPPPNPDAAEMRDMDGDAAASPPSVLSSPTPIVSSTPHPPTDEQQQHRQSTPRPMSAAITAATTAADRSERARRRFSHFMRDQQHPMAEEEEQERLARMPRWRKAIKSIFPGF
ncbi:MAG: hypothetical protein Q9179_004234 [Wetmoreana sp. 5 TL-2023]